VPGQAALGLPLYPPPAALTPGTDVCLAPGLKADTHTTPPRAEAI